MRYRQAAHFFYAAQAGVGLAVLLIVKAAFGFNALLQFTLIITVLQLTAAIRLHHKFYKTYLDPSLFFVVALFGTHMGQYWLEPFHANKTGLFGGTYSNESLADAIYLTYIAINAAVLGDICAGIRPQRLLAGLSPAEDISPYCWIAGLTVLALSLPGAIVSLRSAATAVGEGNYGSYYTQAGSQGLENWSSVVAGFMPTAAFLCLLGSNRRPLRVAFALLVIVGTSAAWLLTGRRTEAIIPLVAMMWLYRVKVREIRLGRLLIVALLLVFLVSPLVSQLRQTKGKDKYTLAGISKAWSRIDSPLISQINETGFTGIVVVDTMQAVPSRRPFHLGVGYANAALFAIPQFMLPVKSFDDYDSPSNWLIAVAHPRLTGTGLFFGFSCIAEAYLEFGVPGVIFILFLTTYAIGRLSRAAPTEQRIGILLVTANAMIWLPHYARGHILELVRPMVWYGGVGALLIWAIYNLSSRYRPLYSHRPSQGASR